MEDKSIVKGQSESNAPLRNGSIEMNDYIDMLVLEICVNGDSLDKYERILKKMAGDQYQTCVCFIDLFKQIDDKQLFGIDELERLDMMGKSLHLSDKTLDAIHKKLSIHEIKNKIPVSPEKKKSYHKGIFAAILVLAAILFFIILPKKSNNQNVSISASKDTVFIEKNETLEVIRYVEVEKSVQETNSTKSPSMTVQKESVPPSDKKKEEKPAPSTSRSVPGTSQSVPAKQTEEEKDSIDMVGKYLPFAEQGDASAQYNLGLCYLQGIGIERNVAEAEKWLERSASQNFVSAQQVLADYYFEVKNYSEAIPLYRRAAEGGNKDAMWALGVYYKDVKKDPAEAVIWLRKAANRDHAAAQFELAELFRNGGRGVKKSIEEARKYYQAAANQDHVLAKGALKELEGVVLAQGYVFWKVRRKLEPLVGTYIRIELPNGKLLEAPKGKSGIDNLSGVDGEFSVEIPQGAKVRFTALGFKDISLYPSENMQVVMEEDENF